MSSLFRDVLSEALGVFVPILFLAIIGTILYALEKRKNNEQEVKDE